MLSRKYCADTIPQSLMSNTHQLHMTPVPIVFYLSPCLCSVKMGLQLAVIFVINFIYQCFLGLIVLSIKYLRMPLRVTMIQSRETYVWEEDQRMFGFLIDEWCKTAIKFVLINYRKTSVKNWVAIKWRVPFTGRVCLHVLTNKRKSQLDAGLVFIEVLWMYETS